MEDNKLLEVKVGIFVFLMVLLAGVVVFLIGKESNLFEQQVSLSTSFANVSGLKAGAPVRLSGLDVGVVTGIRFPDAAAQAKIDVFLKVRKDVTSRITTESVANIESRGLLGDKIIDITAETKGKPLAEGAVIPGATPRGLDNMIKTAEDIIAEARDATIKLKEIFVKLGDDKLHANIRDAVGSARNILKGVEDGKGLAHAVLFDEQYPEKVRSALTQFDRAASTIANIGGTVQDSIKSVKGVVDSARGVVDGVRTGDGALYQMIFGKEGKRLVEGVGSAVGGVKEIIDQVKKGRGLLHTLLFGEANTNFLADFNAAARDVKQIVSSVKSGKGTLGALLNDPSAYEDLKTILGNVKRNKVLKSLIRFAIEKEDVKQAGAIVEKPNGTRSVFGVLRVAVTLGWG
jgi:phospholipid/cholesterol/gamma-HCH transport system substrate-binding protein